MLKSLIYCDRRVYDKRGYWYNPTRKEKENIFYFIKEPLTLATDYNGGREELKPSMSITIFGNKPFAKEDKIYLEDGSVLLISSIEYHFIEHNIFVKDLLKPIVENITLTLE